MHDRFCYIPTEGARVIINIAIFFPDFELTNVFKALTVFKLWKFDMITIHVTGPLF